MAKKSFDINWEDEDSGFEDVDLSEDSNEFQKLLAEGLSKDEDFETVAVGDLVSAVVSYISPEADDLLLEIGGKESAVMAKQDLRDEAGQLTVNIGDTIEAFVISKEGGEIVLSTSMSHAVAKKHALETAYTSKLPVKGKVLGLQKGGFEVSLLGRRAFCPISHIDNRFVEKPETFIGRELDFLIQKMNGKDLVVSRAALLQAQAKKTLANLRDKIHASPEMDGIVSELRPFGAMVDIGGLTGMVHISELSYGHPQHPEEVVSVGEKVRVKVLNIEESADGRLPRIALSLKALAKDPWDSAAQAFKVGESYTGKVVRLADFGAFVELAPGLDGLIHLSEMSWTKRVHHPKDLLKLGDTVCVRLLELNPLTKKISLTLKSLDDDPWYQAEAKYPVGKLLFGRVAQLKPFGALVELAEGVSGLLPLATLREAYGEAYRKKATPPQELAVEVLAVDSASRRILLSLQGLAKQDEQLEDFKAYMQQQSQKARSEQPKASGSFGELLQASLERQKK